mmetsp:Transcript_102420/g.181888  ORF Transcript_102420/g.181888 Transcript_102420/m.181888 type:complete len:208 (-) Transcript_102420:69-692(-)
MEAFADLAWQKHVRSPTTPHPEFVLQLHPDGSNWPTPDKSVIGPTPDKSAAPLDLRWTSSLPGQVQDGIATPRERFLAPGHAAISVCKVESPLFGGESTRLPRIPSKESSSREMPSETAMPLPPRVWPSVELCCGHGIVLFFSKLCPGAFHALRRSKQGTTPCSGFRRPTPCSPSESESGPWSEDAFERQITCGNGHFLNGPRRASK